MNKQPIEQARDADLRLSWPAMLRAAQRARQLALQTDTDIVVSHDGIIEHLKPLQEGNVAAVQEPPAPYGNKP